MTPIDGHGLCYALKIENLRQVDLFLSFLASDVIWRLIWKVCRWRIKQKITLIYKIEYITSWNGIYGQRKLHERIKKRRWPKIEIEKGYSRCRRPMRTQWQVGWGMVMEGTTYDGRVHRLSRIAEYMVDEYAEGGVLGGTSTPACAVLHSFLHRQFIEPKLIAPPTYAIEDVLEDVV